MCPMAQNHILTTHTTLFHNGLYLTKKHKSEITRKNGGVCPSEKYNAMSFHIGLPVRYSLLVLRGLATANAQLEVNKQKRMNISFSANTQNHNMAVITLLTQSSFIHFFIWLML